jgi:hypothetical protein
MPPGSQGKSGCTALGWSPAPCFLINKEWLVGCGGMSSVCALSTSSEVTVSSYRPGAAWRFVALWGDLDLGSGFRTPPPHQLRVSNSAPTPDMGGRWQGGVAGRVSSELALDRAAGPIWMQCVTPSYQGSLRSSPCPVPPAPCPYPRPCQPGCVNSICEMTSKCEYGESQRGCWAAGPGCVDFMLISHFPIYIYI